MANPPVCRIMDYGKFRYEESQKAKESRKKTIQVSIKEVKFRPKIGKGDFDTKVRHMHDFLQEGHKVKVTLQFRGREMAHPELGSKILDAVIEQLGPLAKVEAYARLEGRNMTMVIAPDKKAVPKKADKPDKAPAASAPDDTPAFPEVEADEAPAAEPATADDTAATQVADVAPAPAVETPAAETPAAEVDETPEPVTPAPVADPA
jgi:translation initiation factor IF-3